MASLIRRMISAVARSTGLHHYGFDLEASVAAVCDNQPPQEPTALPESIPAVELAESAHDQFESAFFGKLPHEIRRQIYEELWRATGTSHHVFHHGGRLRRCACITDHEAADERDDLVENFRREKSLTHKTYFPDAALHRQLSSAWTKHWKCEEHLARRGPDKRSPFLPVLTTCKRMYLECLQSIGEHLTLNFTSVQAAHDFLVTRRQAPISREIRRLNFSFHLSCEDINSYMPWNDSEWKQLWQTLSTLQNVREVRLWLDGRLISDLHELMLSGPALFKCLGGPPEYKLTVSLPTNEIVEDRLTDPWAPRYGMTYFRGVDLQFRGGPAYRPSDKKGVYGPVNSTMPSLEIMAWYSMSMSAVGNGLLEREYNERAAPRPTPMPCSP